MFKYTSQVGEVFLGPLPIAVARRRSVFFQNLWEYSLGEYN